MSQIDDITQELKDAKTTAVQTQTAVASLATGIAALDQKIIDLQTQIANSGAPDLTGLQAAADDLKTANTDLLTQAQAISTALPTPASAP